MAGHQNIYNFIFLHGYLFVIQFGSDDISLASPTIYGLKQMYGICREYGKESDIQSNPAKRQLVSFNSNACTSLALEGMCFESTTTGIHLGQTHHGMVPIPAILVMG